MTRNRLRLESVTSRCLCRRVCAQTISNELFVDTTDLRDWSADDSECQSVDHGGQRSLHDRQTARSSGCLLHHTVTTVVSGHCMTDRQRVHQDVFFTTLTTTTPLCRHVYTLNVLLVRLVSSLPPTSLQPQT